jgi:hypothetical protein
MKHPREFSKGRNVGISRAADTRMAGYFMAMHRDLWTKGALQATAIINDYITLKLSKLKDPSRTLNERVEWK